MAISLSPTRQGRIHHSVLGNDGSAVGKVLTEVLNGLFWLTSPHTVPEGSLACPVSCKCAVQRRTHSHSPSQPLGKREQHGDLGGTQSVAGSWLSPFGLPCSHEVQHIGILEALQIASTLYLLRPGHVCHGVSTGRGCNVLSGTLDRSRRGCSRDTGTHAPVSSTGDVNSSLYLPSSMTPFPSGSASGGALTCSSLRL